MEAEGKRICQMRPKGNQGQGAQMCGAGSRLRVRGNSGPCHASPFPACPTSPLPNTQAA